MSLELGIKGSASCTVTKDLTAKALRSGGLDVFATPIMIALMEEASLVSVDSVGTHLDVSHLSPTPAVLKVSAVCALLEIDRRRLVFAVKAYDETGLIGEGKHERFIVDMDKFTAKCEAKMAK